MDSLLLISISIFCCSVLLVLLVAHAWRTVANRRSRESRTVSRIARPARRQALRDLPFYIEMLVICLEAGHSLQSSMLLLTRHGRPGALRDAFTEVVQNQQTGLLLRDALAALGAQFRETAIDGFVTICLSAQASGADLAASLRELASQCREEQLFEVERRALQAPVRMLPPLLLFVFPCTFLVLAFPIVVRLREQGVF